MVNRGARVGILLLALAVGPVCAQPLLIVDALEASPLVGSDPSRGVDMEYEEIRACVDLAPEHEAPFRAFLEERNRRRQNLVEQGERMFARAEASRTEMVVVTYDRDSSFGRAVESFKRWNAEQLARFFSADQLHALEACHEKEREAVRASAFGKVVEEMGLELDYGQRARMVELLMNMPEFEPPVAEAGATVGYSRAYLEERERWRFEQRQRYLADAAFPFLEAEQRARLAAWQVARREELEARLDDWSPDELLGEDQALRVLVPARLEPLPLSGEKRRIFIECREGQFFLIPTEALNFLVTEKLRMLALEVRGEPGALISRLRNSTFGTDTYTVDLSAMLQGTYRIEPRTGARGHPATAGWIRQFLEEADPKQDELYLLVRPGDFGTARVARAAAEAMEFGVDETYLSADEPIPFELSGLRARTVHNGN